MIQFEDVDLIYPNAPEGLYALSGVTLTIYRGEFVSIYGPCGAGKSSLLALLHRKLRPTSGNVLIDARNLSEMGRAEIPVLRRCVAYLHPTPKLLVGRTLLENVALPLQLVKEPWSLTKRKARSALSDVGLLHKARLRVEAVGPGERQLTALARALVVAPSVLMADEPTTGLDAEVAAQVLEVINRAHLRGTTVLMTSHTLEQAQGPYRRTIHLSEGQVLSDLPATRSWEPWIPPTPVEDSPDASKDTAEQEHAA